VAAFKRQNVHNRLCNANLHPWSQAHASYRCYRYYFTTPGISVTRPAHVMYSDLKCVLVSTTRQCLYRPPVIALFCCTCTDEGALVRGAKKLGFSFNVRTPLSVIINAVSKSNAFTFCATWLQCTSPYNNNVLPKGLTKVIPLARLLLKNKLKIEFDFINNFFCTLDGTGRSVWSLECVGV